MAKNGYSSLVKQRASGATKRRKLDDYETPSEHVFCLTDAIKFKGSIFEPACGSGRMMKALRACGYKVTGSDIKQGKNFLTRTAPIKGNTVTNPPYRDGLAEKFVRHALHLTDGKVAMLLERGFIWGQDRAEELYRLNPPELIIVVPGRIYFFEGGKQMKSQFYSHAWLVWPERKKRGPNVKTITVWAQPPVDFD